MLSELQGNISPNSSLPTAQVRAAAPVSMPATNKVAAAASAVPTIDEKPKVQAPKPVEIKVDTAKMKAELQASLQKLNETMRDGGRNLSFNMDEKVGGLVILVKNADTGEVVRQIPNDVVVRIAHNIEAFKGLLHNELS